MGRKFCLTKVVSGGQTGVDRAALEVAIREGVPHGGWCPRGRCAEDGVIPPQFKLCETESKKYPARTARNVLDSDGTLILYRQRLVGGTELTHRLTAKYNKPCWTEDLSLATSPGPVADWVVEKSVQTLNVAGPRESSAPGIHAEATEFLTELFRCLCG